MAMSLSMLIPAIINNETPHRELTIIWCTFVSANVRFSDREYKPTKPSVMKIGCAIKPTLRSVDARPQSNRMDGERRDGVFHTLYSTNSFSMIATNASGKFTKQLAMVIKYWAAVYVIFPSVNPTYHLRLWCAIFTFFLCLLLLLLLFFFFSLRKCSWSTWFDPQQALICLSLSNTGYIQVQLIRNLYWPAVSKFFCQRSWFALSEGKKSWKTLILKKKKKKKNRG